MVWAAIVAGGSGTRMKSAVPKQFLTIAGETVISRTLRVFMSCTEIDGIVIGVPEAYMEETKRIVEELPKGSFAGKIAVCKGGANRNETLYGMIRAAYETLGAQKDDIFVTHDAVRPFVSEKMILNSISSMDHARISSVAIPATDTLLHSADGNLTDDVPDRSRFYQAQTPQTVRIGELEDILGPMTAEERGVSTDLCGLYAKKGIQAVILPGSAQNIKITGPTDLVIAEALIVSQNSKA